MVRAVEAYRGLMKAALPWNHEGWPWTVTGVARSGRWGETAQNRVLRGDRVGGPGGLGQSGTHDDAIVRGRT